MVMWHKIWISLITCSSTPFYPVDMGFSPEIIEFYVENYYRVFTISFLNSLSNSGAPAAEGRQAEPHTHIRELKGTHELIFSCVPWLAVLLVGAYARRRPRRRWSRATWRPYSNNRLTETCSLGLPCTSLISDIGHPCYDQLTPVKIRYLLTSIMWPYRGLKFTTHRGHVFFQSWPLTKWWFSDWIAGSCPANLFKTGQDCLEAG